MTSLRTLSLSDCVPISDKLSCLYYLCYSFFCSLMRQLSSVRKKCLMWAPALCHVWVDAIKSEGIFIFSWDHLQATWVHNVQVHCSVLFKMSSSMEMMTERMRKRTERQKDKETKTKVEIKSNILANCFSKFRKQICSGANNKHINLA